MALNATELRLIERLIDKFVRPRILLLGYPELLVTEDIWQSRVSWDSLPKRDNSKELWIAHNRVTLGDTPMLESRGLYQALGCDVEISDALSWGGEDFVLDLNHPIKRSLRGRYDIIVDPGTLEHCFNIAQAFENVDALLTRGGFIYHQNAIAFPNYGFWSISPTAFFDFYDSKGYELGQPYCFGPVLDKHGFVPTLVPIDPFGENPPSPRIIGSYVFRKSDTPSLIPTWPLKTYPTQRCYTGKSRTPVLVDFLTKTGDRK